METKVEKLASSRILTTTVVSADERAAAESKALTALASRVKIKGFREGMAPPDIVRQHVDEEHVREETVRVLLPQIMTDALKLSGAKPIIRPAAAVTSLQPLTITLTFVERPATKLKKPDTINVEKKPMDDVTDADVEAFIRKLLLQDRIDTPVARAAAKGDSVIMSLATKDKAGKAIDELTVGRYTVLIGQEELIPELDAHLIGLKKGDKKTVEIAFQDKHDLPALRGKRLTVTIDVSDVMEVKLPELTAEYIETRMHAKRTPETFRSDVRDMLLYQKKNAEMKRREEELYTKVRAATTVDIAPELLDTEVREMLVDLQERLKKQDTTVEQWLKNSNQQWEKVLEEMKGVARDRITLRFGMQELASHVKIEPDAKRMDAAIERERSHAKEHGHRINEKDLQVGGSVFEQILWEQKMQQLVEGLTTEEKKVA